MAEEQEQDPVVNRSTIFVTVDKVLDQHQFVRLGLTATGLAVTCSCGEWVSPLTRWSSLEDHEAMHRVHVTQTLTQHIWELIEK